MTHRYSLVVPLLNDINEFEDTLASVLRHRPPHSQVIVVHNGGYLDPHQLDDEVELTTVEGRPSLAKVLNQAMDLADGEYLALVRPGVEIDENWQLPVEDAFGSERVASVAPLLINVNRPTRIVAAGVETDGFKNRNLCATNNRLTASNIGKANPLGPTHWFAIYRRDVLNAIGQLDERMDDCYLDVEIGLALKTLGFKCSFEPDVVGHLESDVPIRRESRKPHGYSSQRSLQRYSNGGFAQKMAACAREIARSPFDSRWLQHMFQRFSAGRHLHEDQQFHDQLVAARTRKVWENDTADHSVTLKPFATPKVSSPSPTPRRRAA